MFLKAVRLVFSVWVTVAYVIGFIYDASFLEAFGVNYYDMVGAPFLVIPDAKKDAKEVLPI